MRYYIIAGEASGDLHGSNLIRALHRQDADADIRCWGGDRMQAAGATLVKIFPQAGAIDPVTIVTPSTAATVEVEVVAWTGTATSWAAALATSGDLIVQDCVSLLLCWPTLWPLNSVRLP